MISAKRLTLIIIMATAFLAHAPAALRMDVGRPVEPDIMRKFRECKELVELAVKYFSAQESLAVACRAFTRENKWRRGEIRIAIFTVDGICLTHGSDIEQLWRDLYTPEFPQFRRNGISRDFIPEMIARAKAGGGYVSFEFKYGTQHAYVQHVVRNGVEYLITAGTYPEAPEYTCRQLVRSAVQYLTQSGAQDTFVRINDREGRFVRGDIYLWAYKLDGTCVAHGSNRAYVNQNMLDWKDAEGSPRNKKMIDMVKQGAKNGVIEYKERGGVGKKAFFEVTVDPQTNTKYIIGGGYYPGITDTTVRDQVASAVSFLRANGRDAMIRAVATHPWDFRHGPVTVFLYEIDGTLLADAAGGGLVGQNLVRFRDADGTYPVKRIIEEATRDGGGWTSFLERNAYKDVYVEEVVVPDGHFIVGAGYWPLSKERTAKSLADKAFQTLMNHAAADAFLAISSDSAQYLRGDLNVFVIDENGLVFVDGTKKQFVWEDRSALRDMRGQPILPQILSVARAGGGWVEYRINNANYRAFVKMAQKPTVQQAEERDLLPPENANEPARTRPDAQLHMQTYIVGCGYYL